MRRFRFHGGIAKVLSDFNGVASKEDLSEVWLLSNFDGIASNEDL